MDHGPLWLPSWILTPYPETAPDPRPRDGAAGRARTCELKPLPGERPPRTSVAGEPGWTRMGLVSWPVPLEMSPGNEELWEAGVTGPNTDTVLSPPNHPARGLRTAPWCGLLDLHCARMRKVVTVHTFLTGTPFRLQRSRLHRLPPRADRRRSTAQGQRDFPRETAVFWPRTATQWDAPRVRSHLGPPTSCSALLWTPDLPPPPRGHPPLYSSELVCHAHGASPLSRQNDPAAPQHAERWARAGLARGGQRPLAAVR